LSTYFIGLLRFLSGLLYDEAFGRVRRIGSQIFGGVTDTAANARAEDRSLAETLKAVNAGRIAGLVLKFGAGTRLGSENEFSLLVPSDEAIGGLPVSNWDRLSEEPAAFERWYQHHRVPKRFTRAEVAAGQLRTYDGTVVTAELKEGQLVVGNIRVVISDIKWGHGIIHVLEHDLP
jgi:uncharacterized surface protein with fasciclin (FAS1) repeats